MCCEPTQRPSEKAASSSFQKTKDPEKAGAEPEPLSSSPSTNLTPAATFPPLAGLSWGSGSAGVGFSPLSPPSPPLD